MRPWGADDMQERRLRFGIIGGGITSFIGDVHIKAAQLDGLAELVAGCFSRDPAANRRSAEKYHLAEERTYGNYKQMAEVECGRRDGIDFVIVATPNQTHAEIAKTFLLADIPVVCEKPIAICIEDAVELRNLVNERNHPFCVTYTNTGFPMVKQARAMVQGGELGRILSVHGEYLQDHMICPPDSRPGGWRADPAIAGAGGAVSDIGVHVENLVAYITGLKIDSLCANLETIRPDLVLDTSAQILIRYDSGASCYYCCSQVSAGYRNDLMLRIVGEKASLEWSVMDPDSLVVRKKGNPVCIYKAGQDYLDFTALKETRISSGHLEGFYEAMANIYRNFETRLLYERKSGHIDGTRADYPDAGSGVEGVRFIERCVESSKQGASWVKWNAI